MTAHFQPWDYLIVTASDACHAASYAEQLTIRKRLKLLGDVREALVVADPAGCRVGSGGATAAALLEVLHREIAAGRASAANARSLLECLRGKRILIVHGGGAVQGLPAYGVAGKLFPPLAQHNDSAAGCTLFDRQLSAWLRLPAMPPRAGQIVVTAGDVLLQFDPAAAAFAPQGITGLACQTSPDHAEHHGVYCAAPGGAVRRFLQKPSLQEQSRRGVVDSFGRVSLDIGVFNFDAETALRLLRLMELAPDCDGRLAFHGAAADAAMRLGLDFYREICCALGSESRFDDYAAAVRAAGSAWDEALLRVVFELVSPIPCRMHILRDCQFLHIGSLGELLLGAMRARQDVDPFAPAPSWIGIDNRIAAETQIRAVQSWVEGSAIGKTLDLPGDNFVVGVDAPDGLRLPVRACLDILPGRDRQGTAVHFVRVYHCDDRWQESNLLEMRLGGMPLAEWAAAAGIKLEDLWPAALAPHERTAHRARLFPAELAATAYDRWLWMAAPQEASADKYAMWRKADRYSFEEMAALADRRAFFGRRDRLRGDAVRGTMRRVLSQESDFSADDLSHLLEAATDRTAWLADYLDAIAWRQEHARHNGEAGEFLAARAVHSLGSALLKGPGFGGTFGEAFPGLTQQLSEGAARWLSKLRLAPPPERSIEEFARRAQTAACESLRGSICQSGAHDCPPPRGALRSDEIVWGRAPARLDLSGGWTDTPPYSLERGGSVLNAAVLLNTQPPIQVFAKIVPEPVLRMRSIDVGSQIEIRDWEQLLNYGVASGEFALPKASLALSGFAPGVLGAAGESLSATLAQFGGGIELSTLAVIPKGSGLGTSSIMGAVLVAVIHRVLGRTLAPDALFHAVLRLEQLMTTGGGWQDQIGGAIGGLKLVTTQPGLIPQTTVRYVPADALDPAMNNGQTLLYYTGITRLAKNILQQVVGRWLDRDHEAAATLEEIRRLSLEMTEAMARKDLAEFGRLIDVAWLLNKRLDPNSSTAEIEAMLARLQPHLFGAKLLGAGGGGFLLLVCRSAEDAAAVKRLLHDSPPNARARFFDFEVSPQGLAVSVC